jgi:hypothetical protein
MLRRVKRDIGEYRVLKKQLISPQKIFKKEKGPPTKKEKKTGCKLL